MSFRLAEAYTQLSLKGQKEHDSQIDKSISKVKQYGSEVDRTDSKLKIYQDSLKKTGDSTDSFGDKLGKAASKLSVITAGIGAATAALVTLDRMAIEKKGFGDMIEDWTRKLVGFKSKAEEAAMVGQTLAGGSQLQAGFHKQFERFMRFGGRGGEMTGAQASEFSDTGLTFAQEDEIEARQNAIEMQRRKIEDSMAMIKGKAKSGIFSGLEQMGVFDQSSAEKQLQNLRAQKNMLGDLVEDTFTMREEMQKQNKIAAEHEAINERIADREKEREERNKRIADYNENMAKALKAQADAREDAAKEEMKRRAGMVGDVVKETRRSSEFIGLEDMARRAQAAGGSAVETRIKEATEKTARGIERIVTDGVKLKEYPYAKMSR